MLEFVFRVYTPEKILQSTNNDTKQLLIYFDDEIGKNNIKSDSAPGTASTDNKISAMCCHRTAKFEDSNEAGKVIMATVFEARTSPFKDCKNPSISQSCVQAYIY